MLSCYKWYYFTIGRGELYSPFDSMDSLTRACGSRLNQKSTETATSVSLYRKMTLVGNTGPKLPGDFLKCYRLGAVVFTRDTLAWWTNTPAVLADMYGLKNATAAHSFDSYFHLSWFWGRDFGDSVAYRQSSSLVQHDYSQGVSISQAWVSHLQKCLCRLLKKAKAQIYKWV